MFRWARRNGIDKFEKFEREWNDDIGYIRDMIDASPRAAWLVSRVTHLLAAALIVGVGLAAPAAAQVSDQPPAVSVYTITPERIAASVAAVVGLIGAVNGGLALARSAGRIGPATDDVGPSWPWCWGRSAWSSVGSSWPLPTVVSAPATG